MILPKQEGSLSQDRSGLEIEACNEHALGPALTPALAVLLDTCFPDTFEGRTYYKQLPHFRLLAGVGNTLVGQVGIDARIIRVGDACLSVFGIIDLCVAPGWRGQGFGGRLLDRAAGIAMAGQVDALIAMADRPCIYARHGFQALTPAPCRWLAINDRRSMALVDRDMGQCFRYRTLQPAGWPGGPVDLLGYLF